MHINMQRNTLLLFKLLPGRTFSWVTRALIQHCHNFRTSAGVTEANSICMSGSLSWLKCAKACQCLCTTLQGVGEEEERESRAKTSKADIKVELIFCRPEPAHGLPSSSGSQSDYFKPDSQHCMAKLYPQLCVYLCVCLFAWVRVWSKICSGWRAAEQVKHDIVVRVHNTHKRWHGFPCISFRTPPPTEIEVSEKWAANVSPFSWPQHLAAFKLIKATENWNWVHKHPGTHREEPWTVNL